MVYKININMKVNKLFENILLYSKRVLLSIIYQEGYAIYKPDNKNTSYLSFLI